MIFGIVSTEIYRLQAENKAIEEAKKVMSPEQYRKYIDAIHEQMKHRREHREKLEIARESRSLNFWGSR